MTEKQNKEKNSNANKGMVYGIIIGSLLSVLIFALTNNPLSFTLLGMCLVIGLIFGILWDKKQS